MVSFSLELPGTQSAEFAFILNIPRTSAGTNSNITARKPQWGSTTTSTPTKYSSASSQFAFQLSTSKKQESEKVTNAAWDEANLSFNNRTIMFFFFWEFFAYPSAAEKAIGFFGILTFGRIKKFLLFQKKESQTLRLDFSLSLFYGFKMRNYWWA